MDKKRSSIKVRKARLDITFSQFALPPVKDALIVGKKSLVGPQALFRSLDVMLRGSFLLIKVEHPIVEAIIVRKSDLRKVPQDKFLSLILQEAEQLMDESDTLRVDVEIQVSISREVEL